jgi:hypothetical protein
VQAPASGDGSALPCPTRAPPCCGRSLRATHSLSVIGAGAAIGGSPGLTGRCGAGTPLKHGGAMGCGAGDAAGLVEAGGGAAARGPFWPSVVAAVLGSCFVTPAAAGLPVTAWTTGLRFAAAEMPLLTGLGVPLPFADTGTLRPPAAGRALTTPGRMCTGRTGRGVCPVWRGD